MSPSFKISVRTGPIPHRSRNDLSLNCRTKFPGFFGQFGVFAEFTRLIRSVIRLAFPHRQEGRMENKATELNTGIRQFPKGKSAPTRN
jgi:hypothetical protein